MVDKSSLESKQFMADLLLAFNKGFISPRHEKSVSGRGDELNEAYEYHKLAKLFARMHQAQAANRAQEKARQLVAGELNDLDGFDR